MLVFGPSLPWIDEFQFPHGGTSVLRRAVRWGCLSWEGTVWRGTGCSPQLQRALSPIFAAAWMVLLHNFPHSWRRELSTKLGFAGPDRTSWIVPLQAVKQTRSWPKLYFDPFPSLPWNHWSQLQWNKQEWKYVAIPWLSLVWDASGLRAVSEHRGENT